MHISRITTAALMVAFVIGCSQKSDKQAHHLPSLAGTVDLGAVELVPQTPTQFSLGAGKCCILTGKQLAGVIHVQVEMFVTNADRTVWSTPADVSTLAGRQCSVNCFNMTIEMTPKMKTQWVMSCQIALLEKFRFSWFGHRHYYCELESQRTSFR